MSISADSEIESLTTQGISSELNAGNVTVTDFLWSGGKLSGAGTTTVTGTMTITDGRHRIDGRTLESLGTATLSGSRNDLIELENDAVFTNRGQFDVQQDTIININGLGPGGTGQFNNHGSMVFTGPGQPTWDPSAPSLSTTPAASTCRVEQSS